MGREIVYCWKCATRLQSDDFDRQKAFRAGDKVSCGDCIFELVADLSAEEQEAILNPNPQQTKKPSSTKIKTAAGSGGGTQLRRAAAGTTRSGGTSRIPTTKSPDTGTRSISKGSTRPIPKDGTRSIPKKGMTRPIPKVASPEEEIDGEEGGEDEAAAKKKKVMIIGGVAGGLVIVIALVCVAMFSGSGGRKAPPPEEDTTGPLVRKNEPVKKESPKEQAAKTAFLNAQTLKSQNGALAVQWKAWKDLEETAAGTSYEGKPEPELAALKDRIDKEIAALDKEGTPFFEQEQFKKLLELWESNQNRHELPEWKDVAAKRIKDFTTIMDDRYLTAKKQLRAALASGDDGKRQEFVQRISGWGFPEKTAEISNLKAEEDSPDTSANAPDSPKTPAGRAMSAEMKAFLPIWSQAVLPAYAKEFGTAADAILKAGRDQGGDEIKKASVTDSADLRALPAFIEEGRKNAAANLKRGQSVTLSYNSAPSEWKKITGRVVKVDPQRIELTTDQKDKPKLFVEIGDLAAVTLAEHYLAAKKAAEDEKLAAILCLLEGDVEGAKKVAGRNAGRVAERFWQVGAEIREKSPKPSSREYEARNLFHMAEFEFRELRTRINALEKYRLLLSDYNSTEYVKKNLVSIGSHGNEGKEYVFYPKDLKTPGAMNTFKVTKKYSPKAEEALVTTKEIDFQACAENYIQVEFLALPNTSYRCWMYIGGCCLENMSFYYQMSEGKVNDKGKEKSVEPGGRAIDTFLPTFTSLPKEHAKHRPKELKDPKLPFPKDATRWEWIELKLPKTYAAPGAKEIRILTEQPGFGVGYVIVTSKPTPFDPKTKAELDKEILNPPAAPKENQIKGTPDPKEWYLIGPFPETLSAEQGPEKDVDLDKELKGKSGNVKWRAVQASVSGPYAIFDWEKNGQVNPQQNVSVYAMIHVKAPSAMDAQLCLGHDDGGRAWVNGAKLHDNDRGGGVKNDEFKVKIHLEDGWNRVLIKVRNTAGGFGLSMRVTDPGGKAIDGLEYHPLGDQLVPSAK